MNAPVHASNLTTKLYGDLLHTGYVYSDALTLDLYGDLPNGEDNHDVQSVPVSGTNHDITELFSARKLECFSLWVDFHKDSYLSSIAMRARREISKLPD